MLATLREHIAWEYIGKVLDKVIISTQALWIVLDKSTIKELADSIAKESLYHTDNNANTEEVTNTHSESLQALYPATRVEKKKTITLRLDIEIKKHDGKRYILSQDGQMLYQTNFTTQTEDSFNNPIMQAITEAMVWKAQIINEKISVKQLAKQLDITDSFIYKRLGLLTLSNTILEKIATNTLSPLIQLKDLYKANEQLCWKQQHLMLNIK